jgi:hypothetical protein
MLLRRSLFFASFLAWSAPKVAWCEPPSDRLGAEALAEEGAKLMSLGDYEKGCRKYEDSALLDQTPSRLITLAGCQERRGKVASAWAALSSAAELAEARGEPNPLAVAREGQKRLEPQIGRLEVIVPREAQLEDLVITRDGQPFSYALWGLPVATDPGTHVFRVTAPGRQSWQVDIGMTPGPGTVILRVPVLLGENEPSRSDRERELLERRGPIAAAPVVPSTSGSEAAADDTPGRAQRTLGLVLAGAGIASLTIGTVFALSARSAHDDLVASCAGNLCPAAAVALQDDEQAQSTRANVALGVGLAALASGAVVYFSAPTSSSPQTGGGTRVAPARFTQTIRWGASVVPSAASLVAAGSF